MNLHEIKEKAADSVLLLESIMMPFQEQVTVTRMVPQQQERIVTMIVPMKVAVILPNGGKRVETRYEWRQARETVIVMVPLQVQETVTQLRPVLKLRIQSGGRVSELEEFLKKAGGQ
jgi:hypothetical protein